ncbi:hypothetical protein [Nocardioides gilvus]|uniref:hypothetical protein n=1 Tax=Nocardioides gilvus TaxID=1735589 RepID=UPI000D74E5C4|nr:hypothetical protein [Nocardioides gilvus]
MSVTPEVGQAIVIRFDGADTVVWWGSGPEGREVLAAEGGRLLTWGSVEECVAHASEAGWGVDWDAGISNDQSTLQDFTSAQRRLSGDPEPLNPQSALDLWNFATDVAHTLGLQFHDGGRVADLCHEKLTKATVPYAFGLTEYALRWTPAELKVVRRVLGDAVGVVRTGLGVAPGH